MSSPYYNDHNLRFSRLTAFALQGGSMKKAATSFVRAELVAALLNPINEGRGRRSSFRYLPEQIRKA
jgi:hypothetical protein